MKKNAFSLRIWLRHSVSFRLKSRVTNPSHNFTWGVSNSIELNFFTQCRNIFFRKVLLNAIVIETSLFERRSFYEPEKPEYSRAWVEFLQAALLCTTCAPIAYARPPLLQRRPKSAGRWLKLFYLNICNFWESLKKISPLNK